MWKCQSRYFVIMLRQAKNGSILFELPNYNVAIITFLATCKQFAIIRNSYACNLIIMCSQKVLILGILYVTNHNTWRSNKYEFFERGMKVHRINHCTVSNTVIKLNLWSSGWLLLAKGALLNVRLWWSGWTFGVGYVVMFFWLQLLLLHHLNLL